MDEMSLNESYIGLRLDLIEQIPDRFERLAVLDVGCATGQLGKYLLSHRKVDELYGFEYDSVMAKEAAKIYDKVVVGDIEALNIDETLNGKAFNCIFLGDILEHLKSPETVLGELTKYLSEEGVVVISVPNMRHISAIYNLLIKGYWPRNSRGIFDRTHLQVVTRKNLVEWIEGAGLKVVKIKRKFRYRDALGSKFPIHGRLLKRLLPELYTFQFIAVASRK